MTRDWPEYNVVISSDQTSTDWSVLQLTERHNDWRLMTDVVRTSSRHTHAFTVNFKPRHQLLLQFVISLSLSLSLFCWRTCDRDSQYEQYLILVTTRHVALTDVAKHTSQTLRYSTTVSTWHVTCKRISSHLLRVLTQKQTTDICRQKTDCWRGSIRAVCGFFSTSTQALRINPLTRSGLHALRLRGVLCKDLHTKLIAVFSFRTAIDGVDNQSNRRNRTCGWCIAIDVWSFSSSAKRVINSCQRDDL